MKIIQDKKIGEEKIISVYESLKEDGMTEEKIQEFLIDILEYTEEEVETVIEKSCDDKKEQDGEEDEKKDKSDKDKSKDSDSEEDDEEDKDKEEKKESTVIEVTEDTELPGTNLILEKGDKIEILTEQVLPRVFISRDKSYILELYEESPGYFNFEVYPKKGNNIEDHILFDGKDEII
jgi:hypothetical protein